MYEVSAVPGTQSVQTGSVSLRLWSDLAGNYSKGTCFGRTAYNVAVCPQGRLAATHSYRCGVSV